MLNAMTDPAVMAQIQKQVLVQAEALDKLIKTL